MHKLSDRLATSFASAAAARQRLDALDLVAGGGVLDKVPHVHDAIVTGVWGLQAPEAGVVRLYGELVITGSR